MGAAPRLLEAFSKVRVRAETGDEWIEVRHLMVLMTQAERCNKEEGSGFGRE